MMRAGKSVAAANDPPPWVLRSTGGNAADGRGNDLAVLRERQVTVTGIDLLRTRSQFRLAT